jgi:4-hydroxybenzoyl-CoA thioesterase/acyl-CoA thioester hydrolase
MVQSFKTTRRVEFHETDAAGIMHFSVFFNFMEEAEHEFLRQLGLSVLAEDDQGRISWPRVAARCDYLAAVKFEDVLDIEVRIVRVGHKSVTYEFSFSHEASAVATGQMTSVCCRFQPDGTPRSVPIPAWILEKLALPPKV